MSTHCNSSFGLFFFKQGYFIRLTTRPASQLMSAVIVGTAARERSERGPLKICLYNVGNRSFSSIQLISLCMTTWFFFEGKSQLSFHDLLTSLAALRSFRHFLCMHFLVNSSNLPVQTHFCVPQNPLCQPQPTGHLPKVSPKKQKMQRQTLKRTDKSTY